jgi:hypothetical protein
LRKLIRSVFALSFVGIFFTITPPASQAIIAEQPCNQFSWTGEDDTAHQMSLPYNLPLGDTTYSTTYVTTNGTLTFGIPDATFHTYPSTPSISLAGYDWVTFGQGTSLSYGVTSTGFCVEWKVRPFPQSSGDITTIKLTVDTSRLPTWSGIVETTGWLPADLRRGIRFQSGEEVVQISEAFTINGGRPVEMQTCWDGTIIPMSATCPAEPPPGQCWDGSTIPWNGSCPPVPPDTQCWDGTWVAWSQTCPPQPPPITCWDGSVIPHNQTCPPTPPNIVCWDNSTVPWNGTCPVEPQVICWDNSVVHYESECLPTPPPTTCWDGSVIPWNQTCPQVPPLVECWDGSEVNWNEQCPPEPPPAIVYPEGAIYITTNEGGELTYVAPVGMKINQVLFASYGAPNEYQYGTCHAENSAMLVSNAVSNNTLVISADNRVFGDPCGGTPKYLSVVLTIEVDPNYVEPTPSPTPEPTPTETVEPTPTPEPSPEPSPSVSPTPEPTLEPSPTPSPTPTPTVLPTPEPTVTPVVEPSPEPTPSETSTPEPTPTPEPIIEPVQDVIDNASADGIITDSEREIISDALVEEYADTSIPFDVFEASGLDYSDLPPEQPVTLENGVVITAEVADAIEIFESPSELLSTVFADPGKALKAIANVGADLTPEVRKDAQAITVSAVIVSQVIAGTSALTLARNQ